MDASDLKWEASAMGGPTDHHFMITNKFGETVDLLIIRALERVVSKPGGDYPAHLYLGLILARHGDRRRGRREIERGLRGILAWLDYARQAQQFGFGVNWDPRGEIRAEIEEILNASGLEEPDNWEAYLARSEQIGLRVEQELNAPLGHGNERCGEIKGEINERDRFEKSTVAGNGQLAN